MRKPLQFGLLGHNIAYSRSAETFQAIFEIAKVPGTFENFDVEPDAFDSRFKELVRDRIQGVSVTIPYKRKVIEYLDDMDPIASALKAVNSVLAGGGDLCGFNTDCYGFCLPLRPHSERLKHGTALVLGCGGGAKAVVYGLYTDYETRRFAVFGRSATKLTQFTTSLTEQIPNIEIQPVETGAVLSDGDWDYDYDIIVNCTPVGGWNQPAESPLPPGFRFLPGKIYYDLNYNRDNCVIAQARDAGLVTIDGSAMLVGQAIRSFYIWTGEKVRFEPVYRRVFGT